MMMDSQGQFLTCSLENIPTKILKNPIIPISGAIAPVLGIKKPSPIDYYTEYWVYYILTSGASAPVFGMEGALWKLNVMFIWIS